MRIGPPSPSAFLIGNAHLAIATGLSESGGERERVPSAFQSRISGEGPSLPPPDSQLRHVAFWQ